MPLGEIGDRRRLYKLCDPENETDKLEFGYSTDGRLAEGRYRKDWVCLKYTTQPCNDREARNVHRRLPICDRYAGCRDSNPGRSHRQ